MRGYMLDYIPVGSSNFLESLQEPIGQYIRDTTSSNLALVASSVGAALMSGLKTPQIFVVWPLMKKCLNGIKEHTSENRLMTDFYKWALQGSSRGKLKRLLWQIEKAASEVSIENVTKSSSSYCDAASQWATGLIISNVTGMSHNSS